MLRHVLDQPVLERDDGPIGKLFANFICLENELKDIIVTWVFETFVYAI